MLLKALSSKGFRLPSKNRGFVSSEMLISQGIQSLVNHVLSVNQGLDYLSSKSCGSIDPLMLI
jgi:hypothetical protein